MVSAAFVKGLHVKPIPHRKSNAGSMETVHHTHLPRPVKLQIHLFFTAKSVP